jgi:hypothetical protein
MKLSTMREINPKETTRAYAFELWMKAPMPMVTFFKILDVSRLVKISKNGTKQLISQYVKIHICVYEYVLFAILLK